MFQVNMEISHPHISHQRLVHPINFAEFIEIRQEKLIPTSTKAGNVQNDHTLQGWRDIHLNQWLNLGQRNEAVSTLL